MKKNLLSIFAVAVLMVVSTVGYAQTTYTKITSVSGLEAGAHYILVGYDNDGAPFAMSYQKSNNRHALQISETGGVASVTVATDPSSQTEVFEFTLGGSTGAWTIYDPLNDGYLCAPGGGNYLRTQSTLDDKGKWTITEGEEGGFVPVSNGGVEQNYMRYNITSTLFGCYKSSSNVSAPVYFFKAGGSVTPDPEPTNYPTNFTADASGLDVILNWTDATGGQLPHKYLVVGANANTPITVPTDGQPVGNDYLIANVNYGVQTVTFNGLEGGMAYHFAIFPYTNSGSNINYKTDGNYPTAQVELAQMDFLLDEGFNDDLGSFTAYSVVGEQEWHQGTYQGTTYANMNGYASGASHANEDWLISPEMSIGDLAPNTGVYLSFRTAMKFDGAPLRVVVATNYNGGAPAGANWEDITDAFDYSTGNYEWVESGQVDILDIVAGKGTFRVAFVYNSTDEAASSWEIDWVKVAIAEVTSVSENTFSSLSVYPNPAHETVSFKLENDAQVSLFDMTGRVVNVVNMTAGESQYQVSGLENGVYFLNIRYADGKREVARFVKF